MRSWECRLRNSAPRRPAQTRRGLGPHSEVRIPRSVMKLVVGLGNPGARYQGTRHNVGFAVVDALAAGPGGGRFQSKFQASVAELSEGGEKVLLAKPETFMNLSGRCVRQIMDFYQLPL